MTATAFDFYLPSELNASHPPERRGIRRDHVRMMVLDKKQAMSVMISSFDLLIT